MSLEVGIWRIDKGLDSVKPHRLKNETRLEEILEKDISIASPNWMVIDRQTHTDHGGFIDILAIDQDANLVVLELKRDKTPRDVVSQVLDYGSWVKELTTEQIAEIFIDYQKKNKVKAPKSIDAAFQDRFKLKIPDEINESHELVVVASELDASTERIVNYLADSVQINVLFFRVYKDGESEYLVRAWLRDPTETETGAREERIKGEWNGEYYVCFGYPNDIVRDGLERGYIVAGGKPWFWRTLEMLEPGARIWVNLPGNGYIGVAEVTANSVPVDEFMIKDKNGKHAPLIKISKPAASLRKGKDDLEAADYLVAVNWLKTVNPKKAIHEKGFFGNQNSVAKPTTPKWEFTVKRLKELWGIS